jgi:ligand-binding sensor domain-containing protein
LARFDGAQVVEMITTDQIGLPEDEIRRAFVTRDGTIWVTTGYGFARRTPGGEWQTLGYQNPFRDEGIWIFDLAEDANGGIWLGTSGGAYYFTGGEWSLVTYGDPNVELPSAVIRCITIASDGSVWFGTDRGAARLTGSDWQMFRAGADGLINNEVNDILVTPSGEVYFATSGGVTRLQP